MSILTGLRRIGRRTATAVTATVAAAALALGGTAPAQAAPPNRDWLRPGCTWDGAQYWVQRCAVHSPAMGRDITVQIQPAKFGGNGALYLLDGLRATEAESGWIGSGVDPQKMFVDDNITVVMPVGGGGSFYADWNGPAKLDPRDPVNFKWETFLSQELPGYLSAHFGVAPGNNSIAGLSMGAVGALNIAAKHPDRFKQVLSYSGYPTMTLPGAYSALTAALIDGGGYNVLAMYGSVINPRRFENDPFLNMGGLKNTDVYVSAGTGVPSPNDIINGTPKGLAMGTSLETIARASSTLFEAKARAQGIHVDGGYPLLGIHSWWLWGRELAKTKGRILGALQ